MADAAPQPSESNAPQAEGNDGWAPGWRQPTGNQGSAAPKAPKSYNEAFGQAADAIAEDLGLNTAQPKPQQKQAKPKEEAQEEVDPHADLELEIAPGKRLTRKEIAKQFAEFQALQKKHAELEKGSGQKFRLAAEQQKQAQAQLAQAQQALQIKQRLEEVVSKNDEKALLAEFGIDPDKLKQKWIEEAYADAQKSPEQREIDRLKVYEQELAQHKRNQQLEAQKQQQLEQERKTQESTNKLAGNLSQNMMATADKMGLPKTGLTIQRMANVLAGAQAKGIDPTWEQLGNAVKQQQDQEIVSRFDAMTVEDFRKFPQATREKIRKFFLQEVQGPGPTPQGSAPQPRQKQQKQMSTAEYNAFVNNLRSA